MVDLLVYTNHRMGDMYYNTPFPHNVLSIVTDLIFFLSHLFSEKSVFTTRYWWNCVISEVVVSEVNVDVKKRALCWTRYMSDNMFVGPGDKAKRNGYPFLDVLFYWESMLTHWRSSSYCNSGSVFVKILFKSICGV